jgi:hypothetical protein
VVGFVFTDAENKKLGLHLRNGVVEFIDDMQGYNQKAAYTLILDRKAWGQLFKRRKQCREID